MKKISKKFQYNVLYDYNGGGGEYEIQEGFAWTNGVILDLLLVYPDMNLS